MENHRKPQESTGKQTWKSVGNLMGTIGKPKENHRKSIRTPIRKTIRNQRKNI